MQAPQKAGIPVRSVAAPVLTDSGVLRSVTDVRPLTRGRVLVNDATAHRVLLLDPDLRQYTVVAANNGDATTRYGSALGRLIPFLGDSTVLLDREAVGLIIIDPDGKVVRTIAALAANDFIYLSDPFLGAPGFDKQGRLVYRGIRPPTRSTVPLANSGPDTARVSTLPDSAPILRVDLRARLADTVAMVRIPLRKTISLRVPNVGILGADVYNPMPSTDEWALLPDGTIAIVRGHDYHIDWISPSGKVTPTAKMPFDWKRFTLEDKTRMLDSIKRAVADARSKEPTPSLTPFLTVSPKELPDYFPPVRQGQVRADLDGNVWILPATSSLAADPTVGNVYDVVNRRGEVFQRVRLPLGYALVGFGANGTIYLRYSPARGRTYLAKTSIMP